MNNYEKYFGTPEQAALLLNDIQVRMHDEMLYQQGDKYHPCTCTTEVGVLEEWYGTDIGNALYELVGAPLEGNRMDGISTLEWLQEECDD